MEKEAKRPRHNYKFRCNINGMSEDVFVQAYSQQEAQATCNFVFGESQFVHMIDGYHRETEKHDFVIRLITQPIVKSDDEESNCNR